LITLNKPHLKGKSMTTYDDRQLTIMAQSSSYGTEKITIAREMEAIKKRFYEENRLAAQNAHRKDAEFMAKARQVYILSNGGELPPDGWTVDNPPIWLP
jgi:hypothetical protein